MSYCPHCGNKVKNGALYCSKCGKPINENSAPTKSEREQVYHGVIRKCPACGAEVPSFPGICPEFGNSERAASSVQAFTVKIHEYDTKIANAPAEKTGWSSWSNAGKVGWVFLNICTICIPLLVYSILPKKYKAGSLAQQKASFIEGYMFPNEREAILEALIFIKAQLALIVSAAIDGSSVFWEKIWFNKASQVYQKAQISMPNDTTSGQTYAEIVALEQQFNKKLLFRKILAIIIIVLFIAYVILRNH